MHRGNINYGYIYHNTTHGERVTSLDKHEPHTERPWFGYAGRSPEMGSQLKTVKKHVTSPYFYNKGRCKIEMKEV